MPNRRQLLASGAALPPVLAAGALPTGPDRLRGIDTAGYDALLDEDFRGPTGSHPDFPATGHRPRQTRRGRLPPRAGALSLFSLTCSKKRARP